LANRVSWSLLLAGFSSPPVDLHADTLDLHKVGPAGRETVAAAIAAAAAQDNRAQALAPGSSTGPEQEAGGIDGSQEEGAEGDGEGEVKKKEKK
jgi:hypothetical protein